MSKDCFKRLHVISRVSKDLLHEGKKRYKEGRKKGKTKVNKEHARKEDKLKRGENKKREKVEKLQVGRKTMDKYI